MSQIGYMMFALGISGMGDENGLGFTASLFHLFTHAFFKSLLFLGAGAIIHFVHSNEMNDMGGLRKLLPVTHAVFLIACLAIAGVPPFAGFFSKEEILFAAWNNNKAVYFLSLCTSGLTAFYMFRLYFSIFHQNDAKVHDHHGEGTFTMKLPLIILGILTVVTGFVPFASYVTPTGIPGHGELNLIFSVSPVLLALTGIFAAWMLYCRQSSTAENITGTFGGFYRAAYSKFYIDEIYLFVTKKLMFNMVGKPAAWVDKNLVDGTMNFAGYLTMLISELTRGFQSGKVQQYAIYFIGGIITLAVYFIYFWN